MEKQPKIVKKSEVRSLEGISKGDVLLDDYGNKELIISVNKNSIRVKSPAAVVSAFVGISTSRYELVENSLMRKYHGLDLSQDYSIERQKFFFRRYHNLEKKIASVRESA